MPGAIIREHPHIDWFELTIVTEGKGLIYTDGSEVLVEKGDIYVSFPGDFHKIVSSETEALKYDFFSFKTDDEEFYGELNRLVSERKMPDKRLIESPEITYFVSSAIAEFYENSRYRERMLCHLFEEIIICLLRECSEGGTRELFRNSVLSTEELCYQMMHYVDTHLYSMTSLEEIAKELGYRYSYLSHVFKTTTGNTVTAYYQARRLTAAKLLIKEGGINFSGIAQMLNYSSLYTFSKAFKKQFGISPREFKESVKD
ncbi:MAG: helix-turn-helix domain-containing protein [Clostridia bacterium]|nr:helix-turn-helix domain-containing protein [Clostridia bacterium]